MRTAAWISALSAGVIAFAFGMLALIADVQVDWQQVVYVLLVKVIPLVVGTLCSLLAMWWTNRPDVPLDQRPIRYRSFWRHSCLLRFRLWLRRYPADPQRARQEIAPAMWNGMVSRLPRRVSQHVPHLRPRYHDAPRWGTTAPRRTR